MKKQITALLAVALFTSGAFAQGTTKMNKQDESSTQGFRVSVATMKLDSTLKLSGNGESDSRTGSLDQAFGVSFGYASLPVQELGWTANATYIDIQNLGQTVGMIRVDGNLAYALTNIFSIKGGLNGSNFTSGGAYQNFNAGFGFQGGIGIQITKNFGVDVGYTQMNQSGNVAGYNLDIREAGPEIGLNGTF